MPRPGVQVGGPEKADQGSMVSQVVEMGQDYMDQRKTVADISRAYYWWPITEEKIRQAVQKIVDAAQPEKIILFGSFAHGRPSPDSDVDLLVIMESEQNVHARSVRISEILYPRPFPVDIIVRTPAEVAERIALGDCFFREIITKGKVLYEHPAS